MPKSCGHCGTQLDDAANYCRSCGEPQIHLRERRMRETGKPIITVAVNEDERSSSARLRRHGFFTAATPERAVRVAAKLASYGGSSSR